MGYGGGVGIWGYVHVEEKWHKINVAIYGSDSRIQE